MPLVEQVDLGEQVFQSTPPVAGRRCLAVLTLSIYPTSFNPRPPLPGGDAGRCGRREHQMLRFNPRPPLPGGDARGLLPSIRPTACFNPRPPLPGGDAVVIKGGHALALVSIHAPRCREAMPKRAPSSPTSATFQSTPPVAGRRCSSPVTTGSISTKSPHCANLFIPEQKTSYANSAPSGKPHQIRQKRGARTYRGKHVHLGFAQAQRMSGASKSVARKQPCSRTS